MVFRARRKTSCAKIFTREVFTHTCGVYPARGLLRAWVGMHAGYPLRVGMQGNTPCVYVWVYAWYPLRVCVGVGVGYSLRVRMRGIPLCVYACKPCAGSIRAQDSNSRERVRVVYRVHACAREDCVRYGAISPLARGFTRYTPATPLILAPSRAQNRPRRLHD